MLQEILTMMNDKLLELRVELKISTRFVFKLVFPFNRRSVP